MNTTTKKTILDNEGKNIGGVSPMYEARKVKKSISVTDAGWEALQKLAVEYKVTRPELIERIARGIIKIKDTSQSNNGTE